MESNLSQLAKLIRYYILVSTTAAGSGHATSSLSAVELTTALLFGVFRADLGRPSYPNNDRLIFSKGHASPLFYALYAAAGKLTKEELLKYRQFNSPLEGHPTLRFPYTEAPTGSLGQGLSIGLGMAMHAKYIAKLPYRTFVLIGDGEMAEGSVWEAIQLGAYYKLDNLMGILDVNRLGQSQVTMYGHDLGAYERRISAFGWDTKIVDGHNFKEILEVYQELLSKKNGRPKMVIAKTDKGHGVKMLEGKEGWHGKSLPPEELEKAITGLGVIDFKIRGNVKTPPRREIRNSKSEFRNKSKISELKYKLGDKVATRQAAGDALTDLMYRYNKVIVLDGDVKNSLYTEGTLKVHPERYFEMFIAEQNMTGAAIGLWRRGNIPFMTTFSAFMSRTYDQIRMAALAGANIKFIGSHAGVSIGEDGASQMGLEDMAMFQTVWGSVVLYPADAVATKKLVEEAIKTERIVYIRVARPATPVIYNVGEKFPIGGSKVHKVKSQKSKVKSTNKNSKVVVVAAGVTLYEALKAQEELIKEGIEVIVVDAYSVKPIDGKTLRALAKEVDTFITVEDHWYEGGLGDAVLNEFSDDMRVRVYKLAVCKMPRSGKPAELLDYEGISAKGIISKIKSIL